MFFSGETLPCYDDDDDTYEFPNYFLDELKLEFSPKLGERGKICLAKVAGVMQFRSCHGRWGGEFLVGSMTTHMMLFSRFPASTENQGCTSGLVQLPRLESATHSVYRFGFRE